MIVSPGGGISTVLHCLTCNGQAEKQTTLLHSIGALQNYCLKKWPTRKGMISEKGIETKSKQHMLYSLSKDMFVSLSCQTCSKPASSGVLHF